MRPMETPSKKFHAISSGSKVFLKGREKRVGGL
jgi:hypothetical protein